VWGRVEDSLSAGELRGAGFGRFPDLRAAVAEIFVSYTSDDKGWADWIGLELEKLGHTVRIFDWEVSAGGNVVKWMEENHDNADHILCVVSPRYLD
jgi:TIR domain